MATEPKPEIHEALAAILDELPAVGKDSLNQGQGFSFRGIDAIVNAVNPLLGKHGVVPVLHRCELLRWEPRTKGFATVVLNTYRLTAHDGSWVEAQGLGEGADAFDKAVSKANTMAQKVMLGQTFCLATEDDPDSENPETGGKSSSGAVPATQTESRSGAAGAGTGPAAPPAPLDPVGEPWMPVKAKIDAFINRAEKGWEDRRTQLLAEGEKAKLPTDVAKCDEKQLDAWSQILVNLTGNF